MPRWPRDWRGKTWKSGCCRNKWELTAAEVRAVYDALPAEPFEGLAPAMKAMKINRRRSSSKRKAQRAIELLNEIGLLKRVGRRWQKVALS